MRRYLFGAIAVVVVADLAVLAWRVRPQAVINWERVDDGDWASATHDLAGRRYSPLNDLTPTNAKRLNIVCRFPIGATRSFQSNPIVVGGAVFVTTDRLTAAFDGSTCRERWRIAHDSNAISKTWTANRGVAFADGLVIRGTLDGSLVAMDAGTGAIRWSRRIADKSIGEVITMPPVIVDSLVLIGPAGNENAIAGWVGAFHVRDGTPVWRFRTLVDTEAHDPPVGGGAVWTPMSVDTATHTLYLAAGNPAPDYAIHVRRWDDRYTNSVVALDYRTGTLRWARQLTPNDIHDWDLTQAGPIVDSTVIAAGKDGIVRALDTRSGAVRWSTPISRQFQSDTLTCPGTWGGVSYNGAAYSPITHLLYIPSIEWCGRYVVAREITHTLGINYMGGTFSADPTTRSGRLTAIDARDGTIRWVYRSPDPMLAAVTVTAGGVVLTGELGGDFLALDAASGRVLFRHPTGGGMGGGVVSYRVGATQYVAALSGAATNQLPTPITMNASVVVYAIK